jgi:vacuolar protein sorting-associated protein 13A/C
MSDHQYMTLMEVIRMVFFGNPAPPPVAKTAVKFQMTAAPPVEIRSTLQLSCPKFSLETFWKTNKFERPFPMSLARFVASFASIKSESFGANSDLEIRFRSLSLFDTRLHSRSVFKDMMVAKTEVEDQFVMKYHSNEGTSEYLFTIDQAQLILEVAQFFAVRDFLSYPFQTPPQPVSPAVAATDSPLNVKVNFVDPEIVLVRDPERSDSDAVILKAAQWTVTLDVITSVAFHGLGMFFCVSKSF